MLQLSEDEVYSGCQSQRQEEGRGGGQVADQKIQFRANAEVDLLYKVPLSCFPLFSLKTVQKKNILQNLLSVFGVISSKTEDPYLSQLQGQIRLQKLLRIHHSPGFVLCMYDCISSCEIGGSAQGAESRLQHFSTCIIIQHNLPGSSFEDDPAIEGRGHEIVPLRGLRGLLHRRSGNTSHQGTSWDCHTSSCSNCLPF